MTKYYTQKKTTSYRERKQEERQQFIDKIAKIDQLSIVYIDEAGVDNRLYREHGRAPRGKKIYADISGKNRERISIIGGLKGKKFIAPISFTGGCNKEIFNAWLEQILLSHLPVGTTIVTDNATFHKTPETRNLIEYFTHTLFQQCNRYRINKWIKKITVEIPRCHDNLCYQ